MFDKKRPVFEKALLNIRKYGNKLIRDNRLINEKNSIRDAMVEYYKSTEEYEKCKFIKEYFDNLPEDLNEPEIDPSSKDERTSLFGGNFI